jgi:group I intron endonuclease
MRIGAIYVITNLVNGKQYVGQTTRSVTKRWHEHVVQRCRSRSLLRQAVDKYGTENFTVTVLGMLDCSDGLSLLNRAEIAFIRSMDTVSPNGYNLDAGGKNKNTHPTTRRRLSTSHRGRTTSDEVREKQRLAHTGRKHGPMSQEQKDKLRACNLGKKMPEHVKTILRTFLIGNQHGKGHRHTIKTRVRMSASQKARTNRRRGFKLSPEHAAALRASRIGKGHTEESKAKIGAANRGHVPSLETRRKMSLAQIGRRQSLETIAKRGLALMGNQNAKGRGASGKAVSDHSVEG